MDSWEKTLAFDPLSPKASISGFSSNSPHDLKQVTEPPWSRLPFPFLGNKRMQFYSEPGPALGALARLPSECL